MTALLALLCQTTSRLCLHTSPHERTAIIGPVSAAASQGWVLKQISNHSGVMCFARVYTALTAYAVLVQQSFDAAQADTKLFGYSLAVVPGLYRSIMI
ncbi:MAG: hypothetical protein M3460_24865 [Actinomycetota bacterium]|nr:hypothetical protein [Actinomycetota bacterium]